jgi:hypothetical protein
VRPIWLEDLSGGTNLPRLPPYLPSFDPQWVGGDVYVERSRRIVRVIDEFACRERVSSRVRPSRDHRAHHRSHETTVLRARGSSDLSPTPQSRAASGRERLSTHARVMNDGGPSPHPRLGYGAMAATSSLQKSGMSSTTRPQTMVPSRKAGSSTQVAPALTRSSLIPRLPVAR